VTAVEYQGTHVSVTARTVGDQDVTALMADSLFFEQPKTPGDRVGLSWDPNDLHALAS